MIGERLLWGFVASCIILILGSFTASLVAMAVRSIRMAIT